LLDHLTAPQLAEWRAYDRIEPIGGYREDYRLAQVCHLMFELAQSAYGDGKRRTKSSIWDFMPWGPEDARRGAADKPQSVDEMKAVLIGIARSSKVKK
jgi:hypothetical protein